MIAPKAPARRVLVVEDDPKIAQLVHDYLHFDGFAAEILTDGRQALQAALQAPPSAMVLDLNLPGLDGIEVCRQLRAAPEPAAAEVPILMLTARVDELDRLLGLDTGADDYVCKPFSPRELVARVRALVRRSEARAGAPGSVAAVPDPWAVDDEGGRIAWRGQWLPLTALEFRMLRLLLSRAGRVFSRAQLLDCVHLELRDVSDRAIDSHVKNLRRKLSAADPGCDCIASVYGAGYRFDPPDR
jgi:two-component system response regulator BaeR